MNKPQWFALGFIFLVSIILFNILFYSPIRTLSSAYNLICDPTLYSNEGALVAVTIQDAMYSSLTWICGIIFFILTMAMFACFICGWLERRKEN